MKQKIDNINQQKREVEIQYQKLISEGYSFNMKDRRKESILRSVISKMRSFDKKLEDIQYARNEVRKILKDLGIPASKSNTTAVRGYSSHTSGYNLYNSSLRLRGFGKEKFQEIINKLNEAKIHINKIDPFEYNLSGSYGSIYISPVYDLTTGEKINY